MNVEDRVREAQRTDGKDGVFYRTLFIEDNFHVYRYVEKGRGYRGCLYEEEGYILAWSDIKNFSNGMPPSFVPRRPTQSDEVVER